MKKRRRRKSRAARAFSFLLKILALAFLAAALFLAAKFYRIGKSREEKKSIPVSVSEEQSRLMENTGISEEESRQMKQYRNLMILGADREKNSLTAAILCSIEEEEGKASLVSVSTDAVFSDENGKLRTCADTYEENGEFAVMNLLNRNLDLSVDEYVFFDIRALSILTDLTGGVPITLSESDLLRINEYVKKRGGEQSQEITAPGQQLLNGTQALAYCLPSQGTVDEQTAWRFYEILSGILGGISLTDLKTLNQLTDQVLPYMTTGYSVLELIRMLKMLPDIYIADTGYFPASPVRALLNGKEATVCSDLSEEVSLLHQLLFDSEGYVPSETVQLICGELYHEEA